MFSLVWITPNADGSVGDTDVGYTDGEIGFGLVVRTVFLFARSERTDDKEATERRKEELFHFFKKFRVVNNMVICIILSEAVAAVTFVGPGEDGVSDAHTD